MTFVDTNYFLCFLLKDNEDQYQKVESLLNQGSEGKIKLASSTIVLFEIYWVLTSFYGKNKNEIVNTLGKILNLYFIDLPERDILLSALSLFEKTNLDLEDAFNLSYAAEKQLESFATFDVKLAREFKKLA